MPSSRALNRLSSTLHTCRLQAIRSNITRPVSPRSCARRCSSPASIQTSPQKKSDTLRALMPSVQKAREVSDIFFGEVWIEARDEHRRSEEHTSELQSPDQLVCRLLLDKK